MKLRNRLILSYFITGILPLFLIGIIGVIYINHTIFKDFYEFYQGQLHHINYNINTLISDVIFDIENLSRNKYVTVKNDSNFTNFLNADENTFKYNIGHDEQKIIDIFYSYYITHPYINSVYMGRENGAFVRSHPRPRPTKYDPRERPWYKLAKENPDKVMRTEPYMSITSPDVNIGIVRALVDEKGKIYGVIGADITLDKLTEFVSSIKLLKGRDIVIFDKDGRILSYPDKSMLFRNLDELKIKQGNKILNNDHGYIKFNNDKEKNFLFFYTSKETGWKICSVIPRNVIVKYFINISTIIFSCILFISLILIIISFIIVNNFYLPFNKLLYAMNNLVDKIKNKNQLTFEEININTKDEMEELAKSFNIMGKELTETYRKLNGNYRQIKELDKLKSAFISTVSHELRTPLTIIKGLVTLLQWDKRIVTNNIKEELFNMIQNNINRLQSIIDDLLDLSKIETGVFPVNKTKGNVTEVVEKTIEELLPLVVGKNIKIIKKYDDKPIKWNFDNFRIARVFMNILNNAVKFSPENSEITVDLKVIKGKDVEIPFYLESIVYFKKDYLLFSVSDKGIGIEKKYHEKIFEKMFQIEDPLTRRYSGTGIGLSIAKAIVEAHDGLIWCESEGLGKGSTFYVLLPE
ncbi:MAG: sensor histidine kinase [Candidatus Goldbacteria bacterium]|nr:sensor histidine kinase [Candidatus Goldiibacteriota bacterium]